MKTLRNIVLGFLAFFAWAMIISSEDAIQNREGTAMTDSEIFYLASLVSSVIYLHWLFKVWLMPTSILPKWERVIDGVMSKYTKRFFYGTFGFGYLLLAFYVIEFSMNERLGTELPSLVMYSIFFIGLGVLAQVRGLALTLTAILSDSDSEAGIEPQLAPHGDEAAPVQNLKVTQNTPSEN